MFCFHFKKTCLVCNNVIEQLIWKQVKSRVVGQGEGALAVWSPKQQESGAEGEMRSVLNLVMEKGG